MTGVDLGSIVAIDMHTHVHFPVGGDEVKERTARMERMQERFGSAVVGFDAEQLAQFYRERHMMAVTFIVDKLDEGPGVSNEEIGRIAQANPDVLIPFASVHPARPDAAARARDLVAEFGFRGFKFHPSVQAFYPNDRTAYPLYEVLDELGLPAIFHTGQNGAGAGERGGGGIRLKYSNPLFLDDVAADFPDMPIIMAHPSFPWQEEAISIALHKPQVYLELSGWSPKYFPPVLVQYANTLLKSRVLFGTDFPLLTPERWIADLDKTDIREDVRPALLKENAVRLLGLAG